MSGTKIIIDTNLLILLSKGSISVDVLFSNQSATYGISVITQMEALGYPFKSKTEEDFIRNLVDLFEVIYIDKKIANQVINLRKQHRIKLPDAIICATAMVHDAMLYSNDLKLPAMSGLVQKSF